MSNTSKSPLADLERSLEAAFFRKVDFELLEKLRLRMANDQALERLAADTGIHNQQVLQELLDLNFTPHNLLALWLVPLTQVAWADGRVMPAEREAVLNSLRKHGYAEDSPAWRLLESWLDYKPCDEVLTAWKNYAQAVVQTAGQEKLLPLRSELLDRAREVAEAAGGVFGFGSVSKTEETILHQIEDALRPESDV
ncbi:MAG: hypothetical protein HQ518_13035 [Rhodopirellula sp.]|nr:hypothetical protein [Rhodopirellula sp.]